MLSRFSRLSLRLVLVRHLVNSLLYLVVDVTHATRSWTLDLPHDLATDGHVILLFLRIRSKGMTDLRVLVERLDVDHTMPLLATLISLLDRFSSL